MKRIVPIIVTDDEVTDVEVTPLQRDTMDGVPVTGVGKAFRVSVPPDDQLTRDLEGACAYMEDGASKLRFDATQATPVGQQSLIGRAKELETRVDRLRAAFRLDEENEP